MTWTLARFLPYEFTHQITSFASHNRIYDFKVLRTLTRKRTFCLESLLAPFHQQIVSRPWLQPLRCWDSFVTQTENTVSRTDDSVTIRLYSASKRIHRKKMLTTMFLPSSNILKSTKANKAIFYRYRSVERRLLTRDSFHVFSTTIMYVLWPIACFLGKSHMTYWA